MVNWVITHGLFQNRNNANVFLMMIGCWFRCIVADNEFVVVVVAKVDDFFLWLIEMKICIERSGTLLKRRVQNPLHVIIGHSGSIMVWVYLFPALFNILTVFRIACVIIKEHFLMFLVTIMYQYFVSFVCSEITCFAYLTWKLQWKSGCCRLLLCCFG